MNLSTLESIKETLVQLENKEHKLENEIDGLLSRETEFNQSIKRIYSKMPDLNYLLDDTGQLSSKMDATSKIATNVSSKIRILDSAKERVAACLQRIGDILDLKFCTQNIEKALANNDYKQAAAHIHRFLSIDENNLKKSSLFNENLVTDQNLNSLDEAFRKLHQTESNLREIISRKFDEAVQSNNQQDVEKFFKIFPLLNQHELGLKIYSNYLCKLLDESTKVKMSQESNHLNQLKILYECTAKLIDSNQPLIESYYGPGNLIDCIKIVQSECDQKAIKIILSYESNLDLKNLQTTIQRLLKTTQTNIVRNDPREIDQILNDLVSLNSSSERYLNFLVERVIKDLDSLKENKAINKNKMVIEKIDSQRDQSKANENKYNEKYEVLVSLYRNCKLSLTLQDLNCSYALLEEYFLRESISKAIQLDDIDASNNVTSMLDDTFFILKKCSKRALMTKSINVLCAIVNYCVSVLDTVFYDTLNDRLRYGYPISPGIVNALDLSQAYNVLHSGRYLANSTDLENSRLLYLTSLNNFNIACDYIRTFKATVLENARKELNILRKQELDKLEPCLVEFLSVISKFQTTIYSGLSEGLRPFTQEFLVNTDKLIHSFKPNLTTANYEGLINVFTVELTTRLEFAIKKCNFNKLGAYQFNRELRALMNYLASSTGWSIRDKFMKVKHISEILNLENEKELRILYPDTTTTGLTLNEIKQILARRTDWNESK